MNDDVLRYIENHADDFVGRLNDLLAVPSISTDPARKGDVRRACDRVRDLLAGAGAEAEVLETPRHPAVYADTGPAPGGGPTILVYGHYDVQPAGEPSLWKSPPFQPTLRDDAIFARGSADDKGQALTHVLAVEAWKKAAGSVPCRVKFLIEGEEEIGSPSLEGLVREYRDRLACDLVVLSDTSKLSRKVPAITYATMGLVYKEVRLFGPRQDLHSGAFGGTIANPVNVLCSILAALKDGENRVAIPGFYDDVVELGQEERKALAELPFDEERYREDLGAPALDGEAGYTTLERKWARPKLDVNGIYGGYAAEGAMTIIPASAGAKVSMRIVANQDPEKISRLFDERVRALCPKTVRLEIETHSTAASYLTPLDLPALEGAARAVEGGFGVKPAMIREGGTIPIMALFKEELGAESLLVGFADPNCNLHGPNEFFHVSDFLGGIRTSAWLLAELAGAGS